VSPRAGLDGFGEKQTPLAIAGTKKNFLEKKNYQLTSQSAG
jgi:hypothetical protein